MTAKTIKSVLRNKFKDYLNSVSDEPLRKTLLNQSIVTGGSIASMLLSETPNDFDIYFKTKEATALVAKYYVEKWKENPPTRFKDGGAIPVFVEDAGDRIKIIVKSAGIASEGGADGYEYFEQQDAGDPEAFVSQVMADATEASKTGKPKYRPVFLSTNAVSLSDGIQLVIRFYGSVDQIHENYDFVHCTCAWDAESGELRLPPEALESLLSKTLRYKRSKYPLCSMIRTRKFLARGWKINAGQYVKMAWDLNKLDLSNPVVLEDQMVGVDAAYFAQVLQLLKEKGGEKIDEAYLMEVIDKVF